MIRFRPAQGLIDDLQTASAAIESRLEQIREEAKTRAARKRQLAALQLYLPGVLSVMPAQWYEDCSGRTNYTRLLQRIEDWRAASDEEVCLVTFNYDTLLERACDGAGLGLGLGTIPGYIGRGPYSVIRLHGSADWFYQVAEPGEHSAEPESAPLSFLMEAAVDGRVSRRLVRFPDVRDMPRGWFFPAIAIPTATKTDSDFICPEEHQERLVESWRKMTKLLVIGWRGQEDHFYTLVRGKATQLQLVVVIDSGDEAAGAVVANMRDRGGLHQMSNALRITRGFSGALADRILNEILPVS
jgi:hypothetical protein